MCSLWSLCSVSLVITELITESPTLHQGAVCVCWDMPSMLQQFTTVSAFTYCLCRASRPEVRTRATSSSISWACVQPCPWAESSGALGIYQSFSWAPYGHLIPRIFFLSCLANLLFAPTAITDPASCDAEQLLLIVFNRYPKNKT